MERPLVSVIVPAFNSEGTIAETLESAGAQSWRDIEIIIVDDGSTDMTARIAEDFCSREPRARLVRQSNEGVAAARNRGIKEASGQWIAPLDADDLWHPAKIERQIAAARASPLTGLVYSWSRIIDAASEVTANASSAIVEGDVLAEHLRSNFIGNGSTPLIDRKLLDGQPYDSRVDGCADYLLQLRLAARTRFAFVPQYLTGYRVTSSNMSSDALRMIGDHVRLFGLLIPDLPPRYRRSAAREMARWQARLAWVLLRRGRGADALASLAASMRRHPATAVDETLQRFSSLAGREPPATERRGKFRDLDPEEI